MTNEQLIQAFYTAFAKRDYKTMGAFYADNAIFNDEVFLNLQGKQIAAMWHMLCESGKDLNISFSNVKSTATGAECDWVATYTFSRTGRKVENRIHAVMQIQNGKIIQHTDTFPFWRWSRQALGTSGALLGWSGFLRGKVQKTVQIALGKFIEKHPEYQ